jgi:Trk K+ transport system NAD-binding subunit
MKWYWWIRKARNIKKEELLFPRGSTVIRPGDVVTFLVNPRGEARLQRYLQESREMESQEAAALN